MRLTRKWLPVVLLVALLALAFQGSRGIWEPDEGFYSNVAVGMLRSADWLIPRLNGDPFLDKPPLHYWGMALGMELFGANEWGARAANALWFAGAALLVGALAGRWWGSDTGRLAAAIYATMLLPFVAANILTPDTPLAFWTVLSAYCYWRAAGGAGARTGWPWWLGIGAAAGLGILAKGPAMLIFLSPLAAHFAARRGLGSALRCPWAWASASIALVTGGSWYLLMISKLPGAGGYFLDNEIVGRIFTDTYRRNPGLIGGAVTYGPILTLGTLPWSAFWPVLLRRAWTGAQGRFAWRALRERPVGLLLALWIAIPLAILLVARSRLPLYALPVFAPLALVTARALAPARAAGERPSRARLSVSFLLAWCACLIFAKGAAAGLPTERDARALARAIEDQVGTSQIEVAAVDLKHNGLPFYGFRDYEWVTVRENRYPYFSAVETLDTEIREVLGEKDPHLFVVPPARLKAVGRRVSEAGLTCRVRGEFMDYRLLMCDPPIGATATPEP